MTERLLVIVTGLPGTGKTHLGEVLADELGVPFFHKDGIKETLFDALGIGDSAWSHKLGAATYDLFDYLLGTLLPVGVSLVLESNFDPGKSGKKWAKLIEEHNYLQVQVLCKSDGPTLIKRFEERAASGERHPGHVDDMEVLRPKLMKGRIEPLPLNGPLIEVDTTDFDALDYDEIVQLVRNAVEGEKRERPGKKMNPMEQVPQVDAHTAYEQWQAGEIALLDVREQDEWDLGHIEGSEFIPMSQLQWRWREIDQDKKWVCVCRSGSRSQYAAAALRQAGLDIANLEGGMLDWQAHKLPITPPGIVG